MEEFTDLLNAGELSDAPVEKKVELAWHLFDSLESQVVLADRKVQAVFALNAFLIAALSLQSQQTWRAVVANGFTTNIVVDLLLKALFLGCVCLATWSAVRALSPRLSQHKKILKPHKKSLFYFGDITAQSFQDFSASFLSLTNVEAINELLISIHAVSGILDLKYKLLKRATLAISLSLLIWVLIQVNKFLQ